MWGISIICREFVSLTPPSGLPVSPSDRQDAHIPHASPTLPPDCHLQQVAVEVRVGDEARRHPAPTLRVLKQLHQR